ncbi:MAG: S41 family peptidase [Phycisphaerales bacterium]|nr:S41 family peptidase [Phycisphaerales bacterium]
MTRFAARAARWTSILALACGLPLLGGTTAPERIALGDWGRDIWSAALQGDRERLEERLLILPDVEPSNVAVDRFREVVGRRADHATKADAQRLEALAKAKAEMDERIAKGELTSALTSAVAVQTLADDPITVLTEPAFDSIIRQATELVPRAEQGGDWLEAQELLYRLNILFDHSRAFHDELDRVNQRVALLANYAPHRLYDMRKEQAARLDPDGTFPEFNEARLDDLQERLKGIDVTALKRSLYIAAERHIDDSGWRPLLVGGLESLRILATTTDLSESFPNVRDAERVNRFTSVLDTFTARLKDFDPGARECDTILARLMELNEETLALPEPVLLREFGDGAMASLDQYSEIIWPDKLRRFQQATEGNFVGVGILIRHDDKREIMVINPLEGSPAYFAGVKPNDLIVEVDGKSTVGWTLNDAVDRITGPQGREVVLGIRREGVEDVIQIPVIRQQIKIYSVSGWWKTGLSKDGVPQWDWMVDPVNRIAYVRLSQFSDDTFDDLMKAWGEITHNGTQMPNGLILDLRYNPGGLLNSAVNISNLFVPSGRIVSGEDKDEHIQFKHDARMSRATIQRAGVPTVVLINKGSASASEIVSGCLQAYNAAVIVGERSYGKGSVQTVHPVSQDTMLKLTTQYYRLPKSPTDPRGEIVHHRQNAMTWGVNPDIDVPMAPDQIVAALELRQDADMIPEDENGELDPNSPKRPNVRDLVDLGLDPQLETALIILQARAIAEELRPAS